MGQTKILTVENIVYFCINFRAAWKNFRRKLNFFSSQILKQPIFLCIFKLMEPHIITEKKFSYTEVGEGEPLILLHGLFGALSNFKELNAHFSKKFKVINFCLPIYELPLLTANIKTLGKTLHKFIQHKGFEKVHLLGNSLGGHIALIYAAAHPEKVASLVLAGSSGLYENAFGGSFPRREDKSFLRDKIAITFYDPKWVTDELVDECHEAVNNRNKVIRILSIAKSAIRHNMAKEIAKMKFPVCLIWGKNDHITPPHVANEFHRLIPHSDLYWIDKCGHAPMMEHAEEFNKILDAWYAKTFKK